MNFQGKQKSILKCAASVVGIAALGCMMAACGSVVVTTGSSQAQAPASAQTTTAPTQAPATLESPVSEAPSITSSAAVNSAPAATQTSPTVSYLVNPVTLPQEYLITYEAIVDEKLHTVTKGRDAEGRIYFSSGKDEMLFVPVSNDRYELWAPDATGTFVASDEALCTANYVDTATAEFMEYAEQSRKRYNNLDASAGTQEVAGRLCDLYVFDVTVSNFTNQFTLAVDQATGACLLSKQVSAVSGYVTEASGGFECTAFTTENVQLPASL